LQRPGQTADQSFDLLVNVEQELLIHFERELGARI
jgi:hypothetical protein